MTEAKPAKLRRRKIPEDAFDLLTLERAERHYQISAERLKALARAGKIEGRRYGVDWYVAPHQDIPERCIVDTDFRESILCAFCE